MILTVKTQTNRKSNGGPFLCHFVALKTTLFIKFWVPNYFLHRSCQIMADLQHTSEPETSQSHLPIPSDGKFDLEPIPQKDLNDNFQFLESLAASIPPEWREKPMEEQRQLLIHMLNHFRRHELLDEEKYKKLRSDYQTLVRSQYKFLHPELLTLDTYDLIKFSKFFYF